MAYTKEELEKILEEDFLLDHDAFGPGRRNDNVVDSMIICHCLDRDWWEWFAKKAENEEDYWAQHDIRIITDKAHVVEPYLESWGTIGTMEAMDYSINY